MLAYANGFTLWHFLSQDEAAQVRTPSYFDGAHEMLRPGDMILASVGPEEAPDAGILLVAGSTDGGVEVRDVFSARGSRPKAASATRHAPPAARA